MKLQKINIELTLMNKISTNDLIIDLLERKYKKISFHPKGRGVYILKGMDKHRMFFINDLLEKDALSVSYRNRTIENTHEYYLHGYINM